MRSTDPQPPRSAQASEEVLEELCVTLRKLGRSTQSPGNHPLDARAVEEITIVGQVNAELQRRGINSAERIAELTNETGWHMDLLLSECLQYPEVRPFVRQVSDGLRMALRCVGCECREFPPGDRDFQLCDSCLMETGRAIDTFAVRPDLFLYRTYSSALRCSHAGDDTVLVVYPWNQEWQDGPFVGRCRVCIDEELLRRKAD
jgi:hypothetical protein